jgi:hypothetical protein
MVQVLVVHIAWDLVCDTQTSRLPRRANARKCVNLTETMIKTGHFLQVQKPGELHAILIRSMSSLPGYNPK